MIVFPSVKLSAAIAEPEQEVLELQPPLIEGWIVPSALLVPVPRTVPTPIAIAIRWGSDASYVRSPVPEILAADNAVKFSVVGTKYSDIYVR